MLLENVPYPQDPRVRSEAQALVTAGYHVSIIAPRGPGQPPRDTIGGVEVYRYTRTPPGRGVAGYALEFGWAMLAMARLSVAVSRHAKFDVIHFHNPPDVLALVAAPYKLAGCCCIFDHHDISPELYNARVGRAGEGPVVRILRACERITYRVADHVIATNDSYKQLALTRGGKSDAEVTVVRNGPNLARLKPVSPDPELRRRAGTILGYVGVMGPQDGIDHLVRAVGHLVHTLGRSDVLAVVVGEGESLPDLKALARELDVEDHIWFTGFISDSDLLRYLSTADICIAPDPSNPFTDRSTMIKIMEYMALGKPVVAYDLPEHRVSAQKAAVYAAPANDPTALANTVAELMDAPDRRKEMGTYGQKRVNNELAWTHSVPKLLDAYRKIGELSRSRRRSRGRLRNRQRRIVQPHSNQATGHNGTQPGLVAGSDAHPKAPLDVDASQAAQTEGYGELNKPRSD